MNSEPWQPISSLCASIDSLRCCPVMQSIFLRLIRSIICLAPCVPYRDSIFSPRRDEGTETMYICVFDGGNDACRELHRARDSI